MTKKATKAKTRSIIFLMRPADNFFAFKTRFATNTVFWVWHGGFRCTKRLKNCSRCFVKRVWTLYRKTNDETEQQNIKLKSNSSYKSITFLINCLDVSNRKNVYPKSLQKYKNWRKNFGIVTNTVTLLSKPLTDNNTYKRQHNCSFVHKFWK